MNFDTSMRPKSELSVDSFANRIPEYVDSIGIKWTGKILVAAPGVVDSQRTVPAFVEQF